MTVRRLITDADVLAGRVEQPLVIAPGTLITPAARDRAAALGLAIIEGAAEVAPSPPAVPSAAGSSCGCGCGGPGLGLEDGLYLVRISAGVTVSVRRAAES